MFRYAGSTGVYDPASDFADWKSMAMARAQSMARPMDLMGGPDSPLAQAMRGVASAPSGAGAASVVPSALSGAMTGFAGALPSLFGGIPSRQTRGVPEPPLRTLPSPPDIYR